MIFYWVEQRDCQRSGATVLWELEDMVHMAMKGQLKRKGATRYTSASSNRWKPKWRRFQ